MGAGEGDERTFRSNVPGAVALSNDGSWDACLKNAYSYSQSGMISPGTVAGRRAACFRTSSNSSLPGFAFNCLLSFTAFWKAAPGILSAVVEEGYVS